MTDKDDEPIVGMYEVLDALEAAIASAEPAKREALALASTLSQGFPR